MASINPYTGTLGEKGASHLLRRVTFGPTLEEIKQFAVMPPATAMGLIFKNEVEPSVPLFPPTGQPVSEKPLEDVNQFELIDTVRGWWLERMRTGGVSIREKLVFFLHTHFTTKVETVASGPAIYHQNALMRKYTYATYDNFKELSKKICLDNAMLIFLDSRLNTDNRPNENFGREFLELYTIGKGKQVGPDDYTTFTEQDVKAAAKILSGYTNDREYTEIDPDTGIAKGLLIGDGLIADRHNTETKTFSERFGNRSIKPTTVNGAGKTTKEEALEELDQMVDLIFDQEETARFICRKLYRFFVYYEINDEIERDIIGPMAATFTSSGYKLETVLRQLLSSQHFYDMDDATTSNDINGALIKSPLEMTVGLFRFFKMRFPNIGVDAQEVFDIYKGRSDVDGKPDLEGVLRRLVDQGIDFYNPFEVAGYSAYHQAPGYNRNWISANYLAFRYEFIQKFFPNRGEEKASLGIGFDVLSFIRDNVPNADDADVLVSYFVDNLLPEKISDERFDFFKYADFIVAGDEMQWAVSWRQYMAKPTDVDIISEVLPRANGLIREILQSPEFQLF